MTDCVKHILLVAVQVKVIMAYVLDHMANSKGKVAKCLND
nr:MAG TPA: hypothetical protein [Caudoviricetes sp.]